MNKNEQIILQLTNNAITLLVTANTNNGNILKIDTFGQNDREAAILEGTIEELLDHNLVRDKAGKGQIFSLTALGWNVSDELKE